MENFDAPPKKDYEIAFLTKSETGHENVVRLLKQHQFDVTFEGPIRKINLAYKIKKETEGYFGYLHFTGHMEKVNLLSHNLRTNSDVLRFLIITPSFTKTKPAPSQKNQTKFSPVRPIIETRAPLPLSNEALEKKIEEILQ